MLNRIRAFVSYLQELRAFIRAAQKYCLARMDHLDSACLYKAMEGSYRNIIKHRYVMRTGRGLPAQSKVGE